MRYFTKEWYELMQQQIGVEGLLWTFRALRYLTIGCKDILVEDNVSF